MTIVSVAPTSGTVTLDSMMGHDSRSSRARWLSTPSMLTTDAAPLSLSPTARPSSSPAELPRGFGVRLLPPAPPAHRWNGSGSGAASIQSPGAKPSAPACAAAACLNSTVAVARRECRVCRGCGCHANCTTCTTLNQPGFDHQIACSTMSCRMASGAGLVWVGF